MDLWTRLRSSHSKRRCQAAEVLRCACMWQRSTCLQGRQWGMCRPLRFEATCEALSDIGPVWVPLLCTLLPCC